MSLKIVKDKSAECVSLCKDCDDMLDGFIDVYTDDELVPSPFKTLDDAEDFLKIIKKLLEAVHDFE